MGPDPKFLDDIARLAGGAANILSSLQEQIRDEVRSRVEEVAARLDLVPSDELEQAVMRIEKLEKRVAALESANKKPATKKKTTKKKTASKTTAQKAPAKKATKKKPAAKKTTARKKK